MPPLTRTLESARPSPRSRTIFDELMSDVSPTPRRSPAARMRAHSASMATSMTALSASGDAAAGGEPKAVSPGPLDQFAGLAAALEHAAAAIARLDALSDRSPAAIGLAVARPARGGPPSRRLRRARDRSLASRRDDRRGALPDGPRRGDHRARSDLRGGPPRLPAVGLVRPA